MTGYTIKINGKEYQISVKETTNGDREPVSATNTIAKPTNEPAPEKKSVPAASTDGKKVVAPMPGTVLKILSDGKEIKKGEPILVLEAMKMENEIASPTDGIVSVLVSIGAKVNSGDVLAVVQ